MACEMSFLATTPLIGKRVKLSDYKQYFAELFLLLLLGSVYLGIDGLSGIGGGNPIAYASKNAFALIGAIGLYAIRLSSFVAMARNFRMPQRLEWWLFMIPTAAMILCFALSGILVKTYAAAHHYHFCYRETGRSDRYVFAAAKATCPPLPANAVPF